MGKKRPVVQSAEEAQRSAVAERMLAQGKRNFESVYGPTEAGRFNLGEDMAAMREVKMMTDKQIADNLQVGGVLESDQPTMPDGVSFTPGGIPSELQPAMPTEDALPLAPERPTREQEQDLSQFEQMWLEETQGKVSYNQWLASKQKEEENQLSEDPAKRAEQVAQALAEKYPNAPTADMLKEWRRLHGGIYLTQIEDRVFIYRYLKRQEYTQINANPKVAELSEDDVDEDIFKRCLLWPRYSQLQTLGMPAGAIPMIVQQVRLRSLFLDPGYVAQITIKI